jgi:hypothetical protein
MIPEEKLSDFLQTGFEDYLPDEMITGRANTESLVEDFLTYRIAVEESSTSCKKDTSRGKQKRGLEHSKSSLSLPSAPEEPQAAPKKKGIMSFWPGKNKQQKKEVQGQ